MELGIEENAAGNDFYCIKRIHVRAIVMALLRQPMFKLSNGDDCKLYIHKFLPVVMQAIAQLDIYDFRGDTVTRGGGERFLADMSDADWTNAYETTK